MADKSAKLLLDALRGVLAQGAQPHQMLKTILGKAVAKTGADRGVFVEVTGAGRMSFRVLYNFDGKNLTGEEGRFSRNVLARALDSGQTVRLTNALDDPRFQSKESIQDLRLTSVLCMPISVEERIGALVHLESNKPGHFGDEHEQLLRPLVDLAGPALEALNAGEGVIRQRDEARRSESLARRELAENRALLSRDWSFRRFVGRSAVVRRLEENVRRAAEMDFPVLLAGETGTGKSILARVLHHGGPRAKQALVTVFCPSLEKGMVETELFGHKRGAFTGAVADQQGKIQAVEKGTLFLDEIGELPLDIQPKLLRLLQEKTYERIGDPRERVADVRVIAATNRDLDEEVRAGRFRRDLFERLNFVPIRIPPLRERREDVPLLLEHCLERFDLGRWIKISDEGLEFLKRLDFAWPGNVRHLEQLAARLAVDRPDELVGPERLMRLLDTSSASAPTTEPAHPAGDMEIGLPALLAQEEKKWLEAALDRYPKMTRAELADKLKISEAALYKKLRQYEIGR